MILYPNAKINIGLHITGKRPDGFHNLETVFYPVKSLCDILEFLPAEANNQSAWSFSGLKIDASIENNLLYRVFQYFKKKYNIPHLKVHLHKQIPMGAGLGGGSSDAAFFIKGLNELFSLGLSVSQMQETAALFGSDCAFFIENKPAFATGKGEKLQWLDLDLSGYFIVVVYPAIHINTAQAYAALTTYSRLQHELPTQQTIFEKPWFENDFESYAFSEYPVLKQIKQTLLDAGAIAAQMTGSGSAVYGIFETPIDLSIEATYIVWSGKL